MDEHSRTRLEHLMPWYVNGTIGEGDRRWVEQMVREHPDARSLLTFDDCLRKVDGDIRVPADDGLDDLMRRVRADKAARAQTEGEESWWARLLASLGPRPAYGFAAALILVQGAVIASLLLRDTGVEYAETRSAAPPSSAAAPMLQVTFKPDATERAMRLLLINLGGRMVDGPSQLGDYVIAVPAERIETARQALEESGIVDAVRVRAAPAHDK